jgi:hypothetical protein
MAGFGRFSNMARYRLSDDSSFDIESQVDERTYKPPEDHFSKDQSPKP